MFHDIPSGKGRAASARRFLAVSLALHAVALVFVSSAIKDRFGSRNEPVTVMLWSPPSSLLPPLASPPSRRRAVAPVAQRTAEQPRRARLQQSYRARPLAAVPPPAALAQAEPVLDQEIEEEIEEKVEETGALAASQASTAPAGVESGQPAGSSGGQGSGGSFSTLGQGARPAQDKPLQLGSGMSRPHPDSSCHPRRPTMPEQARIMGITGQVLVEFVVHPDGHVGEIGLKNNGAPPVLYGAVKHWLERCRYVPSILETTGKPVPVKMLAEFNFSLKA